ncbi:MAG: TolC family protein, partial [Magnetococcales bacterium]|nr:TolC family protein [Magnetococcales bacterium]
MPLFKTNKRPVMKNLVGGSLVPWLLLAVFLIGPAHPARAGENTSNERVGASVEELLIRARAMNPELAAASLETEAAQARVQGSDALPDPKFQLTLDDISENARGLPGRSATYKYLFQQEIPWWGKRGIKREIAAAENREAEGQHADKV